MSVRDAGHRVGDAGTRGHQRDTQAAGQLCVRLRHVHGGALVAHVDDANAFGVGAHPQGHDVPAAESEDPVDPARLQEPTTPAAEPAEEMRGFTCGVECDIGLQ